MGFLAGSVLTEDFGNPFRQFLGVKVTTEK